MNNNNKKYANAEYLLKTMSPRFLIYIIACLHSHVSIALANEYDAYVTINSVTKSYLIF